LKEPTDLPAAKAVGAISTMYDLTLTNSFVLAQPDMETREITIEGMLREVAAARPDDLARHRPQDKKQIITRRQNRLRANLSRPGLTEIRGLTVSPNLKANDREVDMMEVFRNSNELENVAREVIEINAKVLWGQTRVFNKTAA